MVARLPGTKQIESYNERGLFWPWLQVACVNSLLSLAGL
jgi:hypothetical protein